MYNVRNAVRTRARRAPWPVARQHPCRIHKPLLGTRYSSTVPCPTICTNHDITVYYMQLHIDDAITLHYVRIVLYSGVDRLFPLCLETPLAHKRDGARHIRKVVQRYHTVR